MSIMINGEEYYGIIYKIENMITHQVYIGQTINQKGFKGRYRFKGDGIERVYKYYKFCQNRDFYYNEHLFRAIKKYGFDSFKVDEVHDIAFSEEDLNEKEKYYIKKYDSYEHGYNNTEGGDSFPRQQNEKNKKPVCQISLDGELIKIWNSAQEASKALGISYSNISKVCSGKRDGSGGAMKTAGNFVWVFEKDYDPNKNYKRVSGTRTLGKGTKPVLLLSENNEIVQEFYSLNSVSEILDISPQGVSNICNHKTKHKRYNLVFKSEYMEEQRLNVRESYEEVS